MNRRRATAQIALFLVISIACAYYVVTNVAGPQALREPVRVTMRMADSSSITPTSQVTYRGVVIGTVSDVRIDPGGGGVSVRLALNPDVRIPAATRAVVSMATPLALQTVDLQPAGDTGPFLRDGSVIAPEQTERPMPLETMLVHFTELSEQLRPEDVATVTDALATGLQGAGPELTRILDNSATLLKMLRERQPQLQRLVDGTRTLIGPGGSQGERIRDLAAGLRSLSDQIRQREPDINRILDIAPGTAQQLADLFARSDPAATALLGNLVTTSQIVTVRSPAMEQLIISLPAALSGLGGVVHGDTADFYLVGTQGPVCATPAERRSPTDVTPRPAGLDWNCPADQPNLGPRPAMTTYDPATGNTPAGFQLGSPGGQGTVLGREFRALDSTAVGSGTGVVNDH
ncbi:MlaD family protein [Saccharopolyspora spinosa]|uniref:MlaD family protein n=1 Tax=Saccharopolyspora spinosa TaxID=60894 RepID=UPI000237AA1B|nr:MlaD family protein [Saccharopolyspora spinosa]